MGYWPEGTTILHCADWEENESGEKQYISSAFLIRDGTLIEQPTVQRGTWMLYKQGIDRWFQHLGRSNKSYSERFVKALLRRCIGMSSDELDSYVGSIFAKSKAKKELEKARKCAWADCDEDFKSFIVGMDNTLYFYDAGFCVRLVISSMRSFVERKQFVVRRKKDILRWTMDELTANPRYAAQIGDMRFYKPVSLCVMHIPQFEIKFEVKNTEVFEKGA